MGKMNKIRLIFKGIIMLLTLLGGVVFTIGIHEFTHVAEIKSGGFDVKQVCLLNLLDKENQRLGYVEHNDYKNELLWDETLARWNMVIAAVILFTIFLFYFFFLEEEKIKR